jgi:hypothetical protein
MRMVAIQDTSPNRKWSCFGATAWYSMTSACKRRCPNTYAYTRSRRIRHLPYEFLRGQNSLQGRNLAESSKQLTTFNCYTNSFNQFSQMSAPATSDGASRHGKADNVQKARFFEAIDSRTREESIPSIAIKHIISERTAYYWLRQRRIRGSPAYRRSRNISHQLGRRPNLISRLNVLFRLQILFEINTMSIKFNISISLAVLVHFNEFFKSVLIIYVRLYPCTLSRTHPLATRTKGSNDSRSRESAVEYLITIGSRHCLPAQRQL